MKPLMKVMLALLFMFVVGSLFYTVTAEQSSLPSPVPPGNCVNLPQTEFNSSFQNITAIQLPGMMNITFINQPMTKTGFFYNYTFCNTTVIGSYTVNGCSDLDCWSYDFDVSPGGVKQSTSQGIGSAVFLFLMFGLTCLFGWIGFRLSESKILWVLGIFFLFLSVLFVVYDVWLGYEYHRTFTGLTDSNMPAIMFYSFLILLVSGLLVSCALLFLRWKQLYRYYLQAIKKRDEDDPDMDNDLDFDK